MIDTVLDLKDFKEVLCALSGKTWLELRQAGRRRSIENDIRMCVKKEYEGHFVRCEVQVSVGLEDRLLRCVISRRIFNRHFLETDLGETKKIYEEWVKEAYGEVYEELRFKPVEGFWDES